MSCSPKQKGIMKKAVRASKKDGKGGPMGDAVKGIAQKASDTVNKVGDMKVRDAVKGVAKAAAIGSSPVIGAGMLASKLHGRENAMTRGEGQKKGLLKQAVEGAKKAGTGVLQGYLKGTQKMADKIEHSKFGDMLKKLPQAPQRHRRFPRRPGMPAKPANGPLRELPKQPNPKLPTQMPLPGKNEVRPLPGGFRRREMPLRRPKMTM